MIFNKKQKGFLVFFLILFMTAYGTIFVVVSDPAPWVDPNVVGGDSIYPLTTMLGHSRIGGCIESDPNVGIAYTVLTEPEGFSYEIIEPNEFRFQWSPNSVGIFYARVKLTVIRPDLSFCTE